MRNDRHIWTANDIERQDGRRVLVTGGVSGIGFQVARVMGAKGACVLVAGRDTAKRMLDSTSSRESAPSSTRRIKAERVLARVDRIVVSQAAKAGTRQ